MKPSSLRAHLFSLFIPSGKSRICHLRFYSLVFVFFFVSMVPVVFPLQALMHESPCWTLGGTVKLMYLLPQEVRNPLLSAGLSS